MANIALNESFLNHLKNETIKQMEDEMIEYHRYVNIYPSEIFSYTTDYSEIIKTNPKEKLNNYNNKFIILKLPKNYDIEYLYNYLNKNNKTKNYNIISYLYILNKMLIIVCELEFIYPKK